QKYTRNSHVLIPITGLHGTHPFVTKRIGGHILGVGELVQALIEETRGHTTGSADHIDAVVKVGMIGGERSRQAGLHVTSRQVADILDDARIAMPSIERD